MKNAKHKKCQLLLLPDSLGNVHSWNGSELFVNMSNVHHLSSEPSWTWSVFSRPCPLRSIADFHVLHSRKEAQKQTISQLNLVLTTLPCDSCFRTSKLSATDWAITDVQLDTHPCKHRYVPTDYLMKYALSLSSNGIQNLLFTEAPRPPCSLPYSWSSALGRSTFEAFSGN